MGELLVAAVLVPLLLPLALALSRLRSAAVALAPWAAAPALAAAFFAPPAVIEAPALLLGLRFGLDETGRSFLLFTSVLWLIAGFAARAYHADDPRRHVLWAFWLAALAGNLWLIVALDAAGFYAGFALMSFAGYGLVVHARSDEAWRAGRVYLVMAVLGEAALLAGLLLRVAPIHSIALPLPPAAGSHETLAHLLLFAGFGVKAGVLGLHMWLPLAHPVAPTPASAVLSGAMIKAGVLGWMRFLPLGDQAWPTFGATVTVLGLAAAFAAVAVGLTQRTPKTLLAYSSVSQMGFLTVGIGAALMLPAAWPALSAAIALYALHHALAKGALFLGVAAIPAGGPTRRWALAALALPALALAGAPLSSGAQAKEALKSALSLLPGEWPAWLAWLLPAAAVGTTLLMARFLVVMAAEAPGPKRGAALPWLAAVAASAAAAGFVAPPTVVAAAVPIAIGVGVAAVVLALRPLAATRPFRIPAGDVLAWLSPPVRAAWRGLLAIAALADRATQPPINARRVSPIAVAERGLTGFAVAGLACLLLLTAAMLALWR